ncbi:MAG: PIN domain-containing protein [Nitrospira sp.]|nr:PIN domain-containing protein [Nitrospira sp.]MDH4305011.1 PIN domain-containing protein [Nitrospira sp.]MDH5193297.1 PIN domain-containing protein [Nitrospira sp.]
MDSFLPDTNVMVATVCTWHEHHERAIAEMERRLAEQESLVIATPTLVEAYAVLTRLPPPHRLSPQDALTLIETSFLTEATLVGLDKTAFRPLLREAAEHNIAGGKTYDWVIATCARAARVKTLLTFNTRDFLSFHLDGIQIHTP